MTETLLRDNAQSDVCQDIFEKRHMPKGGLPKVSLPVGRITARVTVATYQSENYQYFKVAVKCHRSASSSLW